MAIDQHGLFAMNSIKPFNNGYMEINNENHPDEPS